jgi:hypothetical protein
MCTLYSITTNQDAFRALFRVTQDSAGAASFKPFWGHDPVQEKAAFENTIEVFTTQMRGHPNAHIFHYATYEPAVPVANQIRTYWWCSPPRTGRQRMRPARSMARETGASFSKDRCVRTSL